MGRRAADNQIDWERIEKEYRLGQKSLRQMAGEFGVQASAISRRAKRECWVQDKAADVKAISDAQIIQSNTHKATVKATPTQEDVLAAATARTTILLSHRTDVARARRLAMNLLEELERTGEVLPLLDELETLVGQAGATAGMDEKEIAKRSALFQKVLELPTRTGVMKALAETMTKLIALEREAYNLENAAKDSGSQDSPVEWMKGLLTEFDGAGTGLPTRGNDAR